MKSELENYTLWYDGTISVTPKQLEEILFKNLVNLDKVFVTEVNRDVIAYNQHAIGKKLGIKPDELDFSEIVWNSPDEYLNLDLYKYFETTLFKRIEHDDLYEKRCSRLAYEIELFMSCKLDDIIKVLIYIIDTFNKTETFWGVGRGSSCSSYLLYLLDLHCVDVVKYDIDIHDFIRLDEI